MSSLTCGKLRVFRVLALAFALAALDAAIAQGLPCEMTFECDGICPAAGATCIMAGALGCVCELPPCDQTFPPACGGDCPPGQACTAGDDGTMPCHCEGVACEQGPFPECAGSCPPPLICEPDTLGQCLCVEPPACEPMMWPQCGGALCPPGQICIANDATLSCECVPAPCEQSPSPECGGPCPFGQTCVSDITGVCHCVPLPCEETAPQCSGACPPPAICIPTPTMECLCAVVPCEESPFPACAGLCPPGLICAAGEFGCVCVPGPCETGVPPQCGGDCPAAEMQCLSTAAAVCECCFDLPPSQVPCCLTWQDKVTMTWDPGSCTTHFNVYRETATKLTDADDNGVADFYGNCFQAGLPSPSMTDGGSPPSGQVHFYLVTAENPSGESSLGEASNGMTRPNLAPCP